MKEDLKIKNGIVIPGHELTITASRAGGPGGQHVNKTSTKITISWNVSQTTALNETQKQRVLEKLQHELSHEGNLVLHASSARSQLQNKKSALEKLAHKIKQALKVPKKRMKSKVPKQVKESRLQEKKKRGMLKKMRKQFE